jgi:hypothetical protein
LLSFANVYFLESGLFNGLQPIQIKKFSSVLRLAPSVVLEDISGGMSFTFLPPTGARLRSGEWEDYSTDPGFWKEIAHQKSGWIAPHRLRDTASFKWLFSRQTDKRDR